jgi:hydrogenase nickel incorporation protein HypB
MCTTCGCGESEARIDGVGANRLREHVHADGSVHSHDDVRGAGQAHEHSHAHEHDHSHDHSHEHSHAPGTDAKRMVRIEQDILARNDAYAAHNRRCLVERGVFALNLVSSPGSGKTSLLCRTIAMLEGQAVAVIEGDQQTSRDAERIRATGAPAVQINTGKGCHLDARMVGQAIETLRPGENSLLMIENVGNLVCPAAFDLGEAHKVVILSVTEGEDKPLKYPDMFRAASVMLLNKVDLLAHLDFDVDEAIGHARRVNPRIRVIRISATSGEGMQEWLDFLRQGVAEAGAARRETLERLEPPIARAQMQVRQPLP